MSNSKSTSASARKTAKLKSAERPSAAKKQLVERHFAPTSHRPNGSSFTLMAVGGLGLGAGTYAEWVAASAPTYAPYLLLGGLVATGWALSKLLSPAPTIYVGDAGVAFERRGEIERLLWCDVKRIRWEDPYLVIEGASRSMHVKQDETLAVGFILKEAEERVAKTLDHSTSSLKAKRKFDSKMAPKPVPVAEVQFAGRHCRASRKPITYERFARICPQCAEIYHFDHVPKECLTCQAPLGDRAQAV